ncbi:CRISPR-associated CARF protein Csx1 [Hyperthermus butylicus]|uniref:DNA repair enzyme n=1 Tax=Hyperthermus butylicus (strain DSM 5456 / JCM 9403 / PLM1-5) TaxID=415426 RepID=A2BKQ3_HYPBU|nr:CRISPR-associated CARF protein Csx1 [Hyperthermus butylicus]ABM80564.1 DNA repair enzyme [Hyperthermus butylicus DSM 5456]
MRGEILAVAPWGDPAGWTYTRYRLKAGGKTVEVESFTGLAAVAKAYPEARILIVAADTLADPAFTLTGYEDVIDSARRYVKNYLCQLQGKAEVHILPGVIAQKHRVFRGKPTDYYYKLLDTLIKPAWEGETVKAIVLDLTHGINYMPSTALKAVEEVAALHALAASLKHSKAETVKVEVYNSDPIILPADERKKLARNRQYPCKPAASIEPPTATIHLIMARRYTTLDLISNIDSLINTAEKTPVKPTSRECTIGRDEKQELDEAVDEALKLLKMLRYGLIPQLVYYTAKYAAKLLEKLKQAYNTTEKLWHEGITVKKTPEKLEVTRCRQLTEAYKTILYTYTIAKILEEELIDTTTPTLNQAEKLRETLRHTAIIESIQSREISKLKKKLKANLIPTEWTPLATVYQMQQQECKDKSILTRDLLAHGGWHTDIIEVKKQDNTVAFKVKEEYKCQNRNIWQIIEELGT